MIDLLDMPSLTAGIQIIETPTACSHEAARSHTFKPWMTGRVYHRRMQKKWRKRYGYRVVPEMYLSGYRLFAHPAIVRAIRERIPCGHWSIVGRAQLPQQCVIDNPAATWRFDEFSWRGMTSTRSVSYLDDDIPF